MTSTIWRIVVSSKYKLYANYIITCLCRNVELIFIQVTTIMSSTWPSLVRVSPSRIGIIQVPFHKVPIFFKLADVLLLTFNCGFSHLSFVLRIFIRTKSEWWRRCVVTPKYILAIWSIPIITVVNDVLFTLLARDIPIRLVCISWLCWCTVFGTSDYSTILAVIIVHVPWIRRYKAIRNVWCSTVFALRLVHIFWVCWPTIFGTVDCSMGFAVTIVCIRRIRWGVRIWNVGSSTVLASRFVHIPRMWWRTILWTTGTSTILAAHIVRILRIRWHIALCLIWTSTVLAFRLVRIHCIRCPITLGSGGSCTELVHTVVISTTS